MASARAHLVTGKPMSRDKPWEKVYRADAAGVLSFRCASPGGLITIRPTQVTTPQAH